MGWSMDPGPCFVYVRILVGQVDIPISCSGRHLELEKQWRVGGKFKKFTKPVGGRKKNWGRGRGHPPPPLAFLPQFSQSAANPNSKDENHPNHLHCRLGFR